MRSGLAPAGAHEGNQLFYEQRSHLGNTPRRGPHSERWDETHMWYLVFWWLLKMWSFFCGKGWIPGLRERHFQSAAALSSTLRRSQLQPVLWAQPYRILGWDSHLTEPRRPQHSAAMLISLYLATLLDWTFPWDIYVETKENTPGSFLISANPSQLSAAINIYV